MPRGRGEAGLAGLTTFGPGKNDDPRQVNTHLDIIAWKKGRCFIGFERALVLFDEELVRRTQGSSEPLGILTHHLDHDAGCDAFLEAFLGVAGSHVAARWPSIAGLFSLSGGAHQA